MSDKVMKTQDMFQKTAGADLSLLALIAQADIVVKVVMLILLLSSLWCWAIVFDKLMMYRKIRRSTDRFEKQFWSGQVLGQLYDKLKSSADHPLAFIFVAAMHEWTKFQAASARTKSAMESSIKERLQQTMLVTGNREITKLEMQLPILATVGASAPFIGLFGTVWGIMTSFQSIAASKNTTLAVVAPGIAEALLATGLGLVVAIPAVVFYNILSHKLNHISGRIEDFSNELSILLSHEIDGRKQS